jgi:hypothetical protein
MKGITAKKIIKMLKKIRYQEDNKNMACNISSTEKKGECWHCHKKDYNKEDCWLLYPAKKKEKQ